jgi:hypothetical protein
LDEDAPGIAASSYAADDGLLAELRASWPPAAELPDPQRGYVATDLDGSAPAAALRLGDRFAVPGGTEAGLRRSTHREQSATRRAGISSPGESIGERLGRTHLVQFGGIGLGTRSTGDVIDNEPQTDAGGPARRLRRRLSSRLAWEYPSGGSNLAQRFGDGDLRRA